MFFSPKPRIEFLCRPEDAGVIPEPVRAKTIIPDWFQGASRPRSGHDVDKKQRADRQALHAVSRCDDDRMDHRPAGECPAECRRWRKTLDAGWDFDRSW